MRQYFFQQKYVESMEKLKAAIMFHQQMLTAMALWRKCLFRFAPMHCGILLTSFSYCEAVKQIVGQIKFFVITLDKITQIEILPDYTINQYV